VAYSTKSIFIVALLKDRRQVHSFIATDKAFPCVLFSLATKKSLHSTILWRFGGNVLMKISIFLILLLNFYPLKMEEYLLGGKGKAVDDQSTCSAEKIKLSQESIILVSQVLLLLEKNGLRLLFLRKHSLLTI
jgi:hypothetical protein